MTTITVDLERVLASGKKNNYEGRAYADIVSCIARSKRVVCLTGAGISTSAGIPDFRSKDGLYKLAGGSESALSATKSSKRPTFTRSPSSSSSCSSSGQSSSSSLFSASSTLSDTSSLKGADLFSTQVFSSAASLAKFYRFISNLNKLSESAKPTATHRFIRTLSQKGKLLRTYTQNIDGLEEKVGLTSANPSDLLYYGAPSISVASKSTLKGKSKFQGDLVHLHGRAGLVRCTVCTYTGKWTDEVSQAYEGGYSMPCTQCKERLSLRKALGKRLNVAVGSLRPAITLYGEQGIEDLFISDISNADIGSRPDCLIIFGTSLKVHGFKQLAKDFAREVEENDGKVIYVNLTDPGRDWHSSIHYHVQGHTDTFVEAVLSEWRHIRPQDFHIQSKLSVSDFQPTKDKYNKQSIKEGKKSDALRSERVKESKEAQMVRPVSPSKTARTARRPRYEDDEDYVSPSAKIPRQSRGTAKHAKQDLKNCPLPVMPSLPNFKRISTPAIKVASPTSKKRNVAMARSSDNESCNLRTDDESDMRRPSTAASSVSAAGSPHNHYSQGYKRKKVEAIESRRTWKRVKDDFIVSDSEEDGVDSDYENIPLIAEMDSDDEDTVYVRSSQSAVKTD